MYCGLCVYRLLEDESNFKKEERFLRWMIKFETLKENQDDLPGQIYKLLLKSDTQRDQVKRCMINYLF